MLANQARKGGGVGVGTPGETLSQEKAEGAKAEDIPLQPPHTWAHTDSPTDAGITHIHTYHTHHIKTQQTKQADGKGRILT